MKASYLQSSFLGGLWSQLMQGRADHPKYGTAMAQALNVFPVEEGSCVRRPGTHFDGYARNGKAAKIRTWEFIENQPYTLEFSDSVLRIWNGASLLSTGSNTIASTDTGNPATFTTATAHLLSTGAQVYFTPPTNPQQVEAGITLADRQFVVTSTGADTFTLVDAVSGASLNGSTFQGAGWVFAAILELTTPYVNGAWEDCEITAAQSNQQQPILIIWHNQYPPQLLTASNNGGWSFTIGPIDFNNGPYMKPVQSTTWSLSALTSPANLVIGSIANINGGRGFLSSDVGRIVRLLEEPAAYSPATTYHNGDIVSYPAQAATTGLNGTSYYLMNDPGSSGQSGNDPTVNPTIWSLYPPAAGYFAVIISSVTNSNTVVVTFFAPILNLGGSTFQLQSACATTGWPSCGTYHGGRLWMGGMFPNHLDASVSNDPLNMAPSLDTGQVLDNNAISIGLNTADENFAYWMAPDHLGVIVGTLSGEFLIQASTLAEPITPTSITVNRVTKYGCANTPPVRTGISLVFVQKFRRRALEFLADVFTGKFIAPNLSLTSRDIMTSGIQEIVYQEEQTPILWCRMGNGSLVGCTYRRVSSFTTEEPSFVGWHAHTLSNRLVTSISMGPSPDGTLDSLRMVTLDLTTGVYHIETLTQLFVPGSNLADAWFLDGAIVPPLATVTSEGVVFAGLAHLNGRVASAWVCGLDCGDYTVANGQITVPFGVAGGYFTIAYLNLLAQSGEFLPATTVPTVVGAGRFPAIVGGTYTSQGQILRPIMPQVTGAQNGPALGKLRRIYQFAVLLLDCINGGLLFGTSFDRMTPANLQSPGGHPYTPVQTVSGVQWDTIDDDESFDGMLCWEINRPYPGTICSIEGFLETKDR